MKTSFSGSPRPTAPPPVEELDEELDDGELEDDQDEDDLDEDDLDEDDLDDEDVDEDDLDEEADAWKELEPAEGGSAEPAAPERVKQPLPASVEPLDLVRAVVASVIDRGAEEIVILDLIGRTSYCDYLVLCNGTNARQVSAIANRTVRAVRDLGVRPLGVEGLSTGRWVLIDLSDVIVHVFDGAMRGYYDIDGLWVDATRLSIESLGLQPAPPREEEEPEGDDDWMVEG